MVSINERAARIKARRELGGTGVAPTTAEAAVMETLTRNPAIVANALSGMDPLLISNALTSRGQLLEKLFDPRRDVNEECGYPAVISSTAYREMYDRELGRRVVNVYPEESWKQLPWVYEDEDPDSATPFEESFEALEKKHHLFHYMQRVDELSGIGHYGILLIGLDDGLTLDQPAAGLNERGEAVGRPKGRKIIYLRVLDETLAKIADYEKDVTNPRYGQPTAYLIQFIDPRNQADAAAATQPDTTETRVHWSRVVHIADNRLTSEVLGIPRQMGPWNRLYDLRKVLGGSGEMYWKGGFPGISLETQAGNENAVIDDEAVQTAMFRYMNGLQRYLSLTGMSAKSLAPQISDPTATFEIQIKAICVMLGVPYRVFMGLEEGVVSGDQATRAWDGRLQNRQERYLTPMVINPILKRFIELGVLEPTAEEDGWVVEWPDPHSPSDLDKAEVAGKQTEAFAKYVSGGVDSLIPPFEFLTLVCGFEKDVAEVIMDAAVEHINAANPDLPDVTVPGRDPAPPEPEPGEAVVDGSGKVVTLPPGTKPPKNIPKPPKKAPTANEAELEANYNPSQPRARDGKWTTGGGGLVAGEAADVGTARNYVVAAGVETGAEHAVLLTADGTVAGVAVSGTEDGGTVELPSSELLAKPGADLTVVHNHPDGNGISPPDVLMLGQNPGLGAVEAVTHDGTVYRIKPLRDRDEIYKEVGRHEGAVKTKVADKANEYDKVTPQVRAELSALKLELRAAIVDQMVVDGFISLDGGGPIQNYNPSQPRGKDGKWRVGGGGFSGAAGGAAGATSLADEATAAGYPPVNPKGYDTMSLHHGPGGWGAKRAELHDEMEAEMLKGAPSQDKPVYLFMGGGPAAGKGTLLGTGAIELPPDAVHLDPDEFKGKLPEYKAMVAKGNPKAAQAAHEESSYLSKRVSASAVAKKANVVNDGTGDSGYDKMAARVQEARAGGHLIKAHYVTVDTDVAVERAQHRAARTGRHVPESVIRGTHRAVSGVVRQAEANALFDELTVWDTSGAAPKKIMEQIGGKTTVHDAKAYNKFLAKETQ
jgi:predicted ABC-type ATPase